MLSIDCNWSAFEKAFLKHIEFGFYQVLVAPSRSACRTVALFSVGREPIVFHMNEPRSLTDVSDVLRHNFESWDKGPLGLLVVVQNVGGR